MARTFKFWPRIFKLLWRTNKTYFIGILTVNILQGFAPAAIILAIQTLINSVVIATSSGEFQYILTAFVLFLVITFANDLLSIMDSYYRSVYNTALGNHINYDIANKATQLDLENFENAEIQDHLKRAKGEASYKPFQIFSEILNVISTLVTIISASLILILWNWWFAFFIILIPFLSFISFLKLGQQEFLIHFNRAPKQRESWYLSYLMTRDLTYKEIKLYGLAPYLLKKYKGILDSFFSEDKKIARQRLRIFILFQSINITAIGFIVYFILREAFLGAVMIGNVVGMIQAVNLTQTNSKGLVQGILSLCQNNLYITQLFYFLDYKSKSNKELGTSKDAIKNIESIEVKNVSFKYPNTHKNALNNINLSIKKGETVAVIGKNGSGKTTLIKILTQLYNNHEGDILVNQKSIQSIDLDSYHKKIGIVFQDFIQYEMKVRDNIGFGNIGLKENNLYLNNAIENAGISDVINAMPKGLDTQLGKWFHNGEQLSGGQWQRIAIARSFFRDADMYILDEPSSYLDPNAEKEVFTKFKELIDRKIGIFISHRISSAKLADKIIVMDNGSIVEVGTHQELMNLEGLYAELYNIQAEAYNNESLSEIQPV